MRVLLDTCVLTELRDPQGNLAVKAAVASVPDDNLYLSVLVVGEIARGITLLRDARRKRSLSGWLNTLECQFADRILPVDAQTAHVWGDIVARVQQAGLTLPVIEGLLAATSLRHGLYIMSQNTTLFASTGALVVNPWNESEKNDDRERKA
jgi:toxin FitB